MSKFMTANHHYHSSGQFPASCEWCKGYTEQTAWLAGRSVHEAEVALAARGGSTEANGYNDGATVATRDYIRRQLDEAHGITRDPDDIECGQQDETGTEARR